MMTDLRTLGKKHEKRPELRNETTIYLTEWNILCFCWIMNHPQRPSKLLGGNRNGHNRPRRPIVSQRKNTVSLSHCPWLIARIKTYSFRPLNAEISFGVDDDTRSHSILRRNFQYFTLFRLINRRQYPYGSLFRHRRPVRPKPNTENSRDLILMFRSSPVLSMRWSRDRSSLGRINELELALKLVFGGRCENTFLVSNMLD